MRREGVSYQEMFRRIKKTLISQRKVIRASGRDTGDAQLFVNVTPPAVPGTAPSPGPMKVAADQLRTLLGVTTVNFVPGKKNLAIIDSPLVSA